MRGKLVFLCVVVLLVSSCGQALVKPTQPNNLPDLVTDHIITPYDHYYPGSTVELSVKLSMAPKEIWFGGNWNLVKSNVVPANGVWEDKILIEQKHVGDMSIAVVLNMDDGTKKTLNKTIKVVDKPQINVEQSRSSKTGDKLIVWADVELSKVEYIDPNGKKTSFAKQDKEFSLEQKLPEPGKPAGTIKTTDMLGTVAEKQITASNIDEPKIYYTSEHLYTFDELTKYGRLEVIESPLDLSYKKTAFEINIKFMRDDELDNLKKITLGRLSPYISNQSYKDSVFHYFDSF